jgi:hypothetical protein
LRISIQYGNALAIRLCGNGDVNSERGFPTSAFLPEEGNYVRATSLRHGVIVR